MLTPSALRKSLAPSRHSGESSLSPQLPEDVHGRDCNQINRNRRIHTEQYRVRFEQSMWIYLCVCVCVCECLSVSHLIVRSLVCLLAPRPCCCAYRLQKKWHRSYQLDSSKCSFPISSSKLHVFNEDMW